MISERQLTSFVIEMQAGEWAVALWGAFWDKDEEGLQSLMDAVAEMQCKPLDGGIQFAEPPDRKS